MIIRAAVTHSNLKNLYKYSVLQLLATPTSTTTDAIALKFFANTIL